ncbi:hypothetical protein [Moheibacter stercoris]|uniref:Uncharacterized protein n=1 Tax=Moheibacter stercoris TaxID=1628251 RepID=A0ABV2LT00_9FLAO
MEILIIMIVLFALFPLILILGVAFWAAKSRKKKQELLKNSLPEGVKFSALVRFNSGNQQDKFLKFKAFEGSGILYVHDGFIEFKSTKGLTHRFDLNSAKIYWEGENLVNGLLKWFSISDGNQKMYFNVESGVFIFHTDPSKTTTKQIYESLVLEQINRK